MSELRHDPIQKRWVIIATGRSERPDSFSVEYADVGGEEDCPFCPGREHMTPPEIAAYREGDGGPDSEGWTVRVVPNKYPALRIEGELTRRGVGLYDQIAGIGAHEVVIEGPDHEGGIAGMDLAHATAVYHMLQERLRDLMLDGRFKYVLLFKNEGAPAGATLAHPHHQIIATPVTPKTVAMELNSAKEHYLRKERCLFCDIINQEIEAGDRVVTLTDHFVAFAPYASRSPFELFIAPRHHQHSFTDASPESLRGLAEIMQDVLGRLRNGLDHPPFNYVFHSSPNTDSEPKRPNHWATLKHDFHWHIEIVPRLTRMAGFEWGTGFYINPTPPEAAAQFLRTIDPRPGGKGSSLDEPTGRE